MQAADVVANFGTNYIKTLLRPTSGTKSSPTEAAKAELFKKLLPLDTSLPSVSEMTVTLANELDGSSTAGLRFELRLG